MTFKDLTRKWKHTSQPSARVAFLQELSSDTLDENELEKYIYLDFWVNALHKETDSEVQAAKEAIDGILCLDTASQETIQAQRKTRKESLKAQKELKIAAREERRIREMPVCTVNEEEKTLDILAKGAYPANVLSNYHRVETPFYVDGIECNSIEGFLQALKFEDIQTQKQFCLLSGATAHYQGNHVAKCKRWLNDQTLFWNGVAYKRDSEEYQLLVAKAYWAKFDISLEFRQALRATVGYTLTHNNGRDDLTQTILTQTEFLTILNELREQAVKSDSEITQVSTGEEQE